VKAAWKLQCRPRNCSMFRSKTPFGGDCTGPHINILKKVTLDDIRSMDQAGLFPSSNDRECCQKSTAADRPERT
jgi:hypothetical protein